MIVREAGVEDAGAIARVHVDSWRTTYRGIVPDELLDNLSYEQRESSWCSILRDAANQGQFVYVAEEESGQIVGFAAGGIERTGDRVYQGELYAIYLLETHQGKGIGRRLALSVAQRLAQLNIHSLLVWVLADNPACRFYEALGGKNLYEKQIELGKVMLDEIAYGWTDTTVLGLGQ